MSSEDEALFQLWQINRDKAPAERLPPQDLFETTMERLRRLMDEGHDSNH